MNARKYAGGSRGPRRPGSRKVKMKRRAGKSKGCAIILFACLSLPAIVATVMR